MMTKCRNGEGTTRLSRMGRASLLLATGMLVAPAFGIVTMTVTPTNITVDAGDAITFDIYVETDNPTGVRIRGYQITLPCSATLQVGASGSINHINHGTVACDGYPNPNCDFDGYSVDCAEELCFIGDPGGCGNMPGDCIPDNSGVCQDFFTPCSTAGPETCVGPNAPCVSNGTGVCDDGGECAPASPAVDTTRADFIFPPSMFSNNVGIDFGMCPTPNADPRVANAVAAGQSRLVFPNQPKYLATFRYRVASGSYGTFTVNLLGVSNPPTASDRTRMTDQNNVVIAFTPVNATIQVRQCNDTADCDDGTFCNGLETCVANLCQPGSNPCINPLLPKCDEGGNACVECLGDGQCDDGIFCNGAETCVSGACQDAANRPAGTPCGDGSDTDCTNPDTCNGFGTCSSNHAPNGTLCEDGSFCTVGSTCSSGACVGGTDRNCGDGLTCTTDSCNENTNVCDHVLNPGFCVIGAMCIPSGQNNPANDCESCDPAQSTSSYSMRPNGTMCPDEGNDCTDDECLAGVCTHSNSPPGTPCSDGNPCTGTGDPGIGIDTCDGNGGCSGMLDPDCNDTCANAVVAMGGANVGSNVTASGTDDAEALCQPNSNHDVWWKFTASCDGLVQMTTTGSMFTPSNDTVLSVYDACGGMQIACNDDGGPGALSALSFNAVGGTMYWIRVAGFGNNIGSIVLNIETVTVCLIDGVCYPDGTVNPTNECEFCDTSLTTTDWSPRPKGTVCGSQASSVCDNPDACDGMGFCEPDNKPDGTPCTDDGNDCTDDVCSIGVCVHPNLASGTACGGLPGMADTDCDNPNTCNGLGLCLDNFEQAGLGCGDAADTDCDNPDTCDGSGGCLDNLEADGTACTDDGNDCKDDVCGAGMCTHPNEPAGTPCVGVEGDPDCDNPNTCNGGGVCLDNFEPDGLPCDDGSVCTAGDLCVSGSCVGDPIPDAPLVVAVGARRIEVTPQPAGSIAAVALRLTSPFFSCLLKYVQADGTLGGTPVFQLPADWGTGGTIVVSGSEIIPLTPYVVQAVCGPYVSDPGSDTTWTWGDVDDDGDVDINDINAVLDAFSADFSYAPLEAVDLAPCDPNAHIDIDDILAVLDAFSAMPYPCPGPC